MCGCGHGVVDAPDSGVLYVTPEQYQTITGMASSRYPFLLLFLLAVIVGMMIRQQ